MKTSKSTTSVLGLTLLFTVSLFLQGCKKDNPTVTTAELLVGSWELRMSTNGQTGKNTEYSPDNGNILTFTKTEYKIYSNGQLVNSGVYKIIKEKSILTGQLIDRIIYNNETNSVMLSVQIQNDKLIYSVEANDGESSVYERK